MRLSTLSIILTQDSKLHKTFRWPSTQPQCMQHMKEDPQKPQIQGNDNIYQCQDDS